MGTVSYARRDVFAGIKLSRRERGDNRILVYAKRF